MGVEFACLMNVAQRYDLRIVALVMLLGSMPYPARVPEADLLQRRGGEKVQSGPLGSRGGGYQGCENESAVGDRFLGKERAGTRAARSSWSLKLTR